MSDLDLANPYEPDAFERRSPTPPAPAARPPADREDALPGPAPAREPEPGAATRPDGAPVPWKGAASSVPKLRQQPVSYPPASPAEAFPGFAQDAAPVRGGAAFGDPLERAGDDDPITSAVPRPRPLAVEPPFWVLWLEQARALPLPLLLGVAAALLGGLLLVSRLRPDREASVSLAVLRQNPEAYDGRVVSVRGRAGEAFSVGDRYVFDLRQGRDTIVVYSPARRPALHEDVRATGTVSVGYLDGVPRIALLEETPAR